MRELTAETVADYLHDQGVAPPGTRISARELGGGVSNVVIRVDVEGVVPLVLKQSRAQLRTQLAWFSRLDRIWIERDALALVGAILPPGAVPAIVFEDHANFLIAMTCAPDDAEPWKARLLRGEPDLDRARQAGALLGAMHAETVSHPALDGPMADHTVFDQLRIDPYYRQLARVYPDLRPALDALIAQLAEPVERTFVHADFSPKNMLAHRGGFTVVDFETAHAGDPAFDLGFFLTHLMLKAFRADRLGTAHDVAAALGRLDAFWSGYLDRAGGRLDDHRARRGAVHTAACCLARLDGKSPVDYLDQFDQDAVRRYARDALLADALDWPGLRDRAIREMRFAGSLPRSEPWPP
jgi:5-methylthioribose kinase